MEEYFKGVCARQSSGVLSTQPGALQFICTTKFLAIKFCPINVALRYSYLEEKVDIRRLVFV